MQRVRPSQAWRLWLLTQRPQTGTREASWAVSVVLLLLVRVRLEWCRSAACGDGSVVDEVRRRLLLSVFGEVKASSGR